MVGVGGAASGSSWISAFQDIQRQMAQAHSAYQKAMSESHMRFLKAFESSNNRLSALLTGQPVAPGKDIHQETTSSNGLSWPDQPHDIPETAGPYPAAPASAPQPREESSAAAPLPSTPTEASSDTKEQIDTPGDIDFKEVLLDVVVDKTGYPKEILSLDMDIEADLGIDSIKRVEILSAIKDEYPWLPEIDPAEIGDIRTLGDVVHFIEQHASLTSSAEPQKTGDHAFTETEPRDAAGRIGRYVLEMSQVPQSGFALPGITESKALCITDDDSGVASALSKELAKNGISARVVKQIPDDCDGLIFLDGLRKISAIKDAVDINRRAFIAAKRIAGRLFQSGGVFVTVQNTGGDFNLSGRAGNRAWLCGLPGLVKTAAIEWPKASVKAIDIDSGSRSAKKTARSICTELLAGGPDIEVGLKPDGSRFCPKNCPVPTNESDAGFDKNAVIVASGGGRGVTAKALIHLARHTCPRLALLGRTRLIEEPACCRRVETEAEIKNTLLQEAKTNGRSLTPMDLKKQAHDILAVREIKSTLHEMKKAGAEAIYITADVQNESAVSAALKSIRKEWGPITGIVHGAGVIADKLIAEKTANQFDMVFNTKVKGLKTLLEATSEDPLRVICLFSSIAARTGNLGQSDYAMANETLNGVACAEAIKRKGSCLVKSLNWGPWDSGMVSPALKAHFEKSGIPLIPIDAGAEIFVKEITDNDPKDVVVVIGPDAIAAACSINPVKQEMNLSLQVNRHKYPFFDSHCIEDAPVVPAAMVIEWFARAGELYNPNMRYAACKELKVLKGIRLKNFYESKQYLKVYCDQAPDNDPARLFLKLAGPGDEIYYTALVELTSNNIKNKDQKKKTPSKLPSWGWDVSEIYKGKLFHGPAFQVIRSLEGISETSATAILDGTEGMSWPGEPWKNDVAALDGGLQLAILWGLHVAKKKSLPTKIGACYNYQNGPMTGPIHCELKAKAFKNGYTISDISFFDKNGKLASMLCDVEMHMLADRKN